MLRVDVEPHFAIYCEMFHHTFIINHSFFMKNNRECVHAFRYKLRVP